MIDEDVKIVQETLRYIEKVFKNDNGGHDYFHSYRVYKIATNIALSEKADLFVVQMAALLHDVDDYKLFGGKVGEVKNARLWLKKKNVNKDRVSKICSIIKNMSYKGNDTKMGTSLEEMIVQDSDRLDAMGAIGIARAFTVGANINSFLYHPDLKPKSEIDGEEYIKMNLQKKTTTINHFYEKLLLLKNYMNTQTAKNIAENRHEYMENFLKEFFDEWDGMC